MIQPVEIPPGAAVITESSGAAGAAATQSAALPASVAADVVNPETQATLFHPGTLLSEDEVEQIEALGIDEVKVRTPLTCDTRHGLCAKCYGRNLATGDLVDIGEAVGVIDRPLVVPQSSSLTTRSCETSTRRRVR